MAFLHELNKKFWEGLEDKKWSNRKNALSELKEKASKPRLASGDYADVCRELRKVNNFPFYVVVSYFLA